MIYVYFTIYLLFINLLGFYIMYSDKKKAKNGEYRIREKTLFLIAILLGGIGVYLGMYKFRHKTKHLSFTVGIPFCIILNITCIYYIFVNKLLVKVSEYLGL